MLWRANDYCNYLHRNISAQFVQFFDTFSCECGAAHLAYLNLREQWIKVIAPLDHCSISYRAVIAETCPHHSNAITKPRVSLSKPQFHIWPTGHRQGFWGCLKMKWTMRIIQLLLLLIYLYISFILLHASQAGTTCGASSQRIRPRIIFLERVW